MVEKGHSGVDGDDMNNDPGKMSCPLCARRFNCVGPPDCWCVKVDTDFDYEDLIIRTGIMSCVCPVCRSGESAEAAPQNS